jgi:hypothetical protein
MFLRNGEYVPDYTKSHFHYYHRENVWFPVGVIMSVELCRIIGSKCMLFHGNIFGNIGSYPERAKMQDKKHKIHWTD